MKYRYAPAHILRFLRLDPDRALDPLLLQDTADLVDIEDISREIVGVGGAAAAAVEPRKAGPAFLLRVDVDALEIPDQIVPVTPSSTFPSRNSSMPTN